MAKKRLVVISGNGLSIACSEEFKIETLSQKLRKELAKDDVLGEKGLEIADGLASYLDGSGTGAAPGFEQLVGAFDSVRRSMDLLKQLREAGSPLATAIDTGELDDVAAFCERVYRKGTAAALREIEAAARIARSKRSGVLTKLVSALMAIEGIDTTFATLNYDTLLLQVLTTRAENNKGWHFADMVSDNVYQGPNGSRGKELHKQSANILQHTNRTRIVHLHGSVQFWRARGDGAVEHFVKISDKPTDRKKLFEAYGSAAGSESQDLVAPLVIYGNQRDKSVLAAEPPFSVAYEVLRKDLEVAVGVLVIGYSFEDAVLNKAISESLAINPGLKGALVVTYGDRLEAPRVNDVLGTEGGPEPVVLRNGIAGGEAIGTSEWTEFISSITVG